MQTMAEFGARVRALRKARGVDQEVIARALGYAVGAKNSPISKLERGQLNLSLAKLFKLAEVLGVSPAELLATPAEREAVVPAAAADLQRLVDRWGAVEPRERELLQECAEFLASPDARLRQRMTERIEDVQRWKEMHERHRGSEGLGGGDAVAS